MNTIINIILAIALAITGVKVAEKENSTECKQSKTELCTNKCHAKQ